MNFYFLSTFWPLLLKINVLTFLFFKPLIIKNKILIIKKCLKSYQKIKKIALDSIVELRNLKLNKNIIPTPITFLVS